MGFYGDGVERPFLDNKGHSPECDVWKSFDMRFLCSCGAVPWPEPRIIPGYSDYELHVDGNIKRLSTGQFLRVENAQRVARLIDDEGVAKSRRISVLINEVFLDLART